VSEALGMKVSEGVYHLDLKQPGDADAKEIADILSNLKAISSILDNTATSGEPIEIKGSLLQGKELSQLDDLLHQAVFKIEAAVNLLGISQSVSSTVAGNLGIPGMQGIAVAKDPADKSMPAAYVDRVKAMSAPDPQQTIQGLIERLTSLLRDAGSDNQSSSAATATLVQRAMTGQPAAATMLNQVKPLGASVMRVILKVDAAQATSAENQKAANQSEKMDLPKTQSIVMGRDLLDPANVVQDNVSSAPDGSAAARLLDLSMQPAANALASARVQQMPERMDQSVVTQLVQNFSSMLKIGSHEVKIMLHPRELGDVHLSVKINGDQVIAKIQVENQQVKQIVESNLQSLKSTLAEHNLKTGSFTVDVSSNPGHDLADRGASYAGEGEGKSGSGMPVDHTAGAAGTATVNTGSVVLGHDTGRRYGSNSLEFYA
jgi:flagellar hook-length control protein FliK